DGMYCSIIGDIINSRIIENRSEVQKKLNTVLNYLNVEYKESIAAKLTITIGDEFQGLFSSAESVFCVIGYIKMEMYPVKIRFGIGFGDISTDIVNDYAIGADGSVYHNARMALSEVKESQNKNGQPVQDTKIHYDFPSELINISILNAAISACTLIENMWTDKQREVIKLIFKNNLSQSELAKILKIQQAGVQKRLASSDYYTYKYILSTVESTVNDLWRRLNHAK
ncbi:MAG: hypothetical protein J7L77_03290, partial [Clostridiales bacterium]|nr:hypothetical protein [Clostridiales bacterium]